MRNGLKTSKGNSCLGIKLDVFIPASDFYIPRPKFLLENPSFAISVTHSVSCCCYMVVVPFRYAFHYTVMHICFQKMTVVLPLFFTASYHDFFFFRYCSYLSIKLWFKKIIYIQSPNESSSSVIHVCIHLHADTFSFCKRKQPQMGCGIYRAYLVIYCCPCSRYFIMPSDPVVQSCCRLIPGDLGNQDIPANSSLFSYKSSY